MNRFTSVRQPLPAPRLRRLLSATVIGALGASADLLSAFVYWPSPENVLRAIAGWSLGAGHAATLPTVVAVAVATMLLLYVPCVLLLRALLGASPWLRRHGFAAGMGGGLIMYVFLFQALVPLLTGTLGRPQDPAWVLTCIAVHLLLIGPGIVALLRLEARLDGTSARRALVTR